MLFHTELLYLLKITDKNKIMHDSIIFSKVYQEAVEDYMLEQEKKHISHSLENWDYTLLHTSNLTKKQKKNRAKNKSAKQSRKINRK